jgi:RecJ-like exonuclease
MAKLEDVAGDALAGALRSAADFLLTSPHGIVRVVSHHDADGICAGSLLVAACRRSGLSFHATLTRNLEADELEMLEEGDWDIALVSDMGSGQVEGLAASGRPVIILDHHIKQGGERPGHVLEVNANDYGLEGAKDVSGATLAFLFALALAGDEAWDLAPLALAGTIGDKQLDGEGRSVNHAVLEEAVRRGVVERKRSLMLSGDTLAHTLEITTEPYLKGLTGHPEEVGTVLGRLGIDGSKAIVDLGEPEVRSLGSYLVIWLVRQGVHPRYAQQMAQERLWWPARGTWLDDFTNQVNASGRLGRPGVGVGACLGDQSHLERCRSARDEYRTQVRTGLLELDERGTQRLEHVQWFEAPSGHIAGSLAGLGMIYIFEKDIPVLSLFPSGEKLHVSARATDDLVEMGVDLSEAMAVAAKEVGGLGGGHPVASGATVPAVTRDSFLQRVDELVGKQLGT